MIAGSRVKNFSLALCILASACGVFVAPDPSASEPKTSDDELSQAELPVQMKPFIEGTYTQQLDHPVTPGPSVGTFQQRFWYSTEFAKDASSPVLLYMCGEWTCSGDEGRDSVADTAKLLGAAVVVLEHRYYGESVPFSELTLANMKFLTIHNALEDTATFQRYAMANLPLKGKWISVGGSYAGMLAAYYRERHPELVVGAWGSSAPINVQLSFWGYDAIASRALGPICSMHVRQVLAALGEAYDKDTLAPIVEAMGYGNYRFPSKVDLLSWVTSWAKDGAQYGKHAKLCAALAQHEANPLDGWIGFLNPPFAEDLTETAMPIADGGTSDADVEDSFVASDATTDGGSPTPMPMRQPPWPAILPGHIPFMPQAPAQTITNFKGSEWFYQVCTEVGFLQVFNPDRTESVTSELESEEYWTQRCLTDVGQTPNVSLTRDRYYAPIARGDASNILLVNGSLDPWSALSFVSQASAPPGVTAFVVRNASHCTDLFNLTRESKLGVFEARKLFVNLARTWLATQSP
jgi:hypothetical protein